MFELLRNGQRWLPSIPDVGYGDILYANVPSLACKLEVVNNKARINGGAWHVLPAMVVNGHNQLAINSHPSGVFNMTFTDNARIFSDINPSDNDAAVPQSVTIDFHNLSASLAVNISAMTPPDTITATFALGQSTAIVAPLASFPFVITRTPKSPIYWGNMADGGVFGFEVIYA